MAYVDPKDPKSPPNYYGVTLVDKANANSGMIFVPENIPHSYDANGDVTIFAAGAFSSGEYPTTLPPDKNRGADFKLSSQSDWAKMTPKASFRDAVAGDVPPGVATCTVAGYVPSGEYFQVGDKSGHPSGLPGSAAYAPGTVIKGPGGVGELVYVKDIGFVVATADSQSTASKAHALTALAQAAEAYAKAT